MADSFHEDTVHSNDSHHEHQIIHDHIVDDVHDDLLLQYEHDDIDHEDTDPDSENIHSDDHGADSNEEIPMKIDVHSFLDELDSTELLNDYNHIIIDHYTADPHSILHQITSGHAHFHCDIDGCHSVTRNHRNRETQPVLNVDGHRKESLSQSQLVDLDLMDSIHCHLLHSLDIGYQMHSDHHDRKSPEYPDLKSLRKHALNKRKRLLQIRGVDRVRNNKFKVAVPTGSSLTEMESLNISTDEKSESAAIAVEVVDAATNRDNVYRFGRDTSSIPMTAKYETLKQEMLNNAVCRMSIAAFTAMILRAQKKLSCSIARSLTSNECGPMLIENVAVLILYCDHDGLRCRYTEALGDCVLSSDRLEEFYNFHFGIESTVRLFGSDFSEKSQQRHVTSFYLHCPSQVTLCGIKCRFQSVTSMSAHMAPVALYNVDRSDTEGMMLQFGPSHDRVSRLNVSYFTCSWISSFGAEDERLFIANDGCLELRNAILSTAGGQCKEMRLFMEALSCFDGLFQAQDAWKSTAATNEHFKVIHSVIDQTESPKDLDSGDGSYEVKVFRAFCAHKMQIEILVQNIRGPFRQFIFQNSSIENFVHFDRICSLFPNCTVIKTWYVANPDYSTPSGVNGQWMHSLYLMLDALNECTQSKLQRLIVHNNHQNVDPVISEKQIGSVGSKFVAKGWQIELHRCSEQMDEIVVTRILIWREIEVSAFNVEDGVYRLTANVVDGEVVMKYAAIRALFEEMNRRLAEEGVGKSEIKELKKAFPSKVLFKKENSEKVMRQRQEKLNKYFRTLIDFALSGDSEKDKGGGPGKARMIIMILLTQFLIK